jgi:DNA-binding transcriptional regulator GbsR (MarR family)
MNETDINDWYIELYIGCPCESKEQLNKREGELIREIGTLNKNIAGKTREEFYKEYYEVNKVFLKEKAKEYYEVNKGFLKEKTKEFYEDNKETIQKQRKDFYEINKDKINEKARNNYLKKKLEKEEAIITIS